MKVTKGSIVDVRHCRKGNFTAVAERDFDTDKETFYPLTVTGTTVSGMSVEWEPDEHISCRGSFCTIRVIKAGTPSKKPLTL